MKDVAKMKRHLAEKCPIKLPCPTCSAPFSTQWLLKRHMNSHTLDPMDVSDPAPAHDLGQDAAVAPPPHGLPPLPPVAAGLRAAGLLVLLSWSFARPPTVCHALIATESIGLVLIACSSCSPPVQQALIATKNGVMGRRHPAAFELALLPPIIECVNVDLPSALVGISVAKDVVVVPTCCACFTAFMH